MKNCNEIQQHITELEFNPIEDKAVLEHIGTCQECQGYQQALNEMNQVMGEMTDFDADDSLVESTLSSIVSLQEGANKPKRFLNTQWASGLAASFMLVSLIALFPYNSISDFGLNSVNTSKQQDRREQRKLDETIDLSSVQKPKTVEAGRKVITKGKASTAKRKEVLHRKKAPNKAVYDFYMIDASEEIIQKQRRVPQIMPLSSAPPKLPEVSEIIGAMAVGQTMPETKTSIDYRDEIKQGFSDAISNEAKLEAPKSTYSRVEENKQQNTENETAEPVAEYENDQDKEILDRVVVTGSRIRSTNLSKSEEQIVANGLPKTGFAIENKSDSTILGNYANVFAHRYSKTTTNEDESELDKLKVAGSRIKRVDLEGAQPVFSMGREDACCAEGTLNPDPKAVGKLSKTKEKQYAETRNQNLSGIKLNSDGIGQALIYPYSLVRDNAETTKDGFLKNENQPLRLTKPLTPAQRYLTAKNSLENLSFQNISGYWANTYLPGDSSMRLLQSSLADNTTMAMNNSINQNIQPFDYPTNSALAVYLNSDVANVQSQTPTRMRIQVGIQASNRQGGQRSAMNMGLVFDLSNKTPEYAAGMKALLLALLKSKQPGDNISLTVSGNIGGVNGLLIEPKEFRHGKIQVVINNLFSEKKTHANSLLLNQALQLTTKQLQGNDDPAAALGASVILLFSANKPTDMSGLESMIHANAVRGITLSTVSLGGDNHQLLKQLALAGQGHARILQSTNDAKRVIDEELLASSRAVARALRLRIRLAKGVKLIEVIDSYNLNEKQSQRVRDAELSLDKRLSKNLGIKTDRGEDEEGIQIVIPSFFAGDTHVILLDVVATNANAIADVTLRYKDLLYLRNAISRKQLNLESNPKSLGPLQYNVMKNTLASKFSKHIKQASAEIRQDNHSQALTLLLEMQNLYQSLRKQFPIWDKDQEILKDEKLLQEYIDILHSISSNDVQKVNYIVDSMQYISWRKHVTQTQ